MDVPRLAELERRRRELLDRIAAVPAEARTEGDAKNWSATMLLEHMNAVDDMTLHDAEVRPGRGSRNPGLPILVFVMRRGWKIPVPGNLAPKGDVPYETLVAASDANHARLADLVARAGPGDVVAQHPPLGALTATQACDLLDSHYRYHLARFPAGLERAALGRG